MTPRHTRRLIALAVALPGLCSVILKAAEETPGTACAFVQCFADAGLPPGVLNLVFGKPAEISATLIASPIIRMITLTGSVQVGKQLGAVGRRAMKPALLELGGHAPVLIGEGVDGAKVVAWRRPPRCGWPARPRIADALLRPSERRRGLRGGLRARRPAPKVGDEFVPDVQMDRWPMGGGWRNSCPGRRCEGPRRARRDGGQRIGERGYFYAPTVLADVPLDADAMTIEPSARWACASCQQPQGGAGAGQRPVGRAVGLRLHQFVERRRAHQPRTGVRRTDPQQLRHPRRRRALRRRQGKRHRARRRRRESGWLSGQQDGAAEHAHQSRNGATR